MSYDITNKLNGISLVHNLHWLVLYCVYSIPPQYTHTYNISCYCHCYWFDRSTSHVTGTHYQDCTNDYLDLYNSSNSALAAYSHVDGNHRQSEGAARCSKTAANYLYLDSETMSLILISDGVDLLPSCVGN